ncbi:hypothetical protein [Nostoc linckia]|nr:hypothetical protein [Nostoc linckia]
MDYAKKKSELDLFLHIPNMTTGCSVISYKVKLAIALNHINYKK